MKKDPIVHIRMGGWLDWEGLVIVLMGEVLIVVGGVSKH